MSLKVFGLFALLVPAFAFGNTISLGDSFCVNTTVRKVHSDITNYDELHNLPGAKYEIKLDDPNGPPAKPGSVGVITTLQMVKSRGIFKTNDNAETDALVWIVLQPLNVADGSFYPRFLLHCGSLWTGDSSFNHVCTMDPSAEHFGLTNFISHIHAAAGPCGDGQMKTSNNQAKITYDLTLETDENQVASIKETAVAKFGVFGPFVARLFVEDSFFRGYFKNFFVSWINGVQ